MTFPRIGSTVGAGAAAGLSVLALLGASPALAGGTVLIAQTGGPPEARLTVTSKAFTAGGTIPARFSSYAANVALPVSWSRGPAGTESYAVAVEDPDASPPTPVVHWLIWNMPPAVTSIPAGSETDTVTGAAEGTAADGKVGYFGPHPPAGDAPHHYHMQVFALDSVLSLPAGATRDELGAAMKGHVLAAGEIIGTYRQR